MCPFCLRIGDGYLTCHVDCEICMTGERLRTFSIIVASNNGTYKMCGSPSNNMSTAEARTFPCEPNTRGTSVKIQINGRKEFLTLCEVFIFGRGMIEVNFLIYKK